MPTFMSKMTPLTILLYVTYVLAYTASITVNGEYMPYVFPIPKFREKATTESIFSFVPKERFLILPERKEKPIHEFYLGANHGKTTTVPKSNFYQAPESNTFDLDDSFNNDVPGTNFGAPDFLVGSGNNLDTTSYFDDMELVDNFGVYLKRRTQIDVSSSTANDAAHRFNALLLVLIALARVVRNSCAEYVYDKAYTQTVENYYSYGMAHADQVTAIIEDYIRKGNARIPKLRRLKQEVCEKEIFCSVTVDNRVKSSPLLYKKELEVLEAIAHLARSFYPYVGEFNQVAQKGTVLPYLLRSKDRIKEYVMNIVNSIEHVSDIEVRCP